MMTNPTWAKSIFAVTLFVEDLETCKAFYQRVFDLPVHFEDPNSAVFKFGDLIINLLEVGEAPELIKPAGVAPAEAGSRFVFTLPVEDVDTLCEQLRARGVDLLNGPMTDLGVHARRVFKIQQVTSGKSPNRLPCVEQAPEMSEHATRTRRQEL